MSDVIVVGAGTMGCGIAFVAARAGCTVDLIDPDAAALDRAKGRIAQEAARANAAVRLSYYAAVPAQSHAELAIEAVPEDLQLKRRVFRELSALPRTTLLATNTSSLSVSEIAEAAGDPQRVVGMHFFNPAAAMQLIEIVRGERTSDDAIARARAYAERFEKTAVVAADTPGFIVNRVARPYYLQALHAYEAGVASFEALDRLARGAGFRMGPFELMDLIGLDVNFATTRSVYERTGLERLAPVALQAQLVRQGRLGRKIGSGFYEYAEGRPKRNDPTEPVADIREERIGIVGFGGVALELQRLLEARCRQVDLWESEEALEHIPLDTTIVIDVGDGVSDRTSRLTQLDELLPSESAIFADAYATDVSFAATRLHRPERLIGYGIIGALAGQRVVEIVNAEATSDASLELAQELCGAMGKGSVLVEDRAGLFLGRTIGSIVNEAVTIVEENVANAEDVDLAMRLGVNYPHGPIEWGRAIGGDRLVRILQRLARAEGGVFAPHHALWVLDVEEQADATP